jgi:hypothetical protein
MARAQSVESYLAALPTDRRAALEAVRAVIQANLPPGYVEDLVYKMPAWVVPLSRYPATYNGQPLVYVALASQKQYMSLYLTCVYSDPGLAAWFRAAYAAAGKRLDMGKSCVRFRALDALPLPVIAEAVRRVSVEELVARYEASRVQPRSGGAARAAAGERAPKRAGPGRAAGERAAKRAGTGRAAAGGGAAKRAGAPPRKRAGAAVGGAVAVGAARSRSARRPR